MLSGPSFRPAFVFSINSLIMSGFPLISFHLAKTSLDFKLSCVQLSKIIYNYSYFWYSFSNQSVLLAQLENVNKLWNNNRNVYVKEQNQNKSKTKSRHIQIEHVLYCSI